MQTYSLMFNFFYLSRFKRTSRKKDKIRNKGLTINNSMFDDARLSSSPGVTAIRMAKKEKQAAGDNTYVDGPLGTFKDEPVTFENTAFDGDDDGDSA